VLEGVLSGQTGRRLDRVNEHRIRLRGGWEWRPVISAESDQKRLTLPVRWGLRDQRRMILTRRFGRPPLEPGSRVLLQMDQVEGVVSLSLNGESIFPVLPQTTRYEIELPALADRNVLVLEIELNESAGATTGAWSEWGQIALIVRSRD
jgi:hypothetical protein